MDQQSNQNGASNEQPRDDEASPSLTVELKIAVRKRETQTSARSVLVSLTPDALTPEMLDTMAGFDVNTLQPLLGTTNINERLKAVRLLRNFLIADVKSVIAKVIKANLLPHLVACLKPEEQFPIKLEAVWCFINISFGSRVETRAVIKAHAVEPLMVLAQSNAMDLAEQSIWAIANILGDSTKARNICLEKGAFTVLMDLTARKLTNSHMDLVSWAFANMARRLPTPYLNIEKIKQMLLNLTALLRHESKNVIFNSLYAIGKISDVGIDEVHAILGSPGLLRKIVKLLSHDAPDIQNLAISIIVNIVNEDEVFTRTISENLPIRHFHKLFASADDGVRKDAFWLLTTMVMVQKQSLVMQIFIHGLIPSIMKNFEHTNMSVRKEVLYLVLWVLTEYTGNECKVFAQERSLHAIQQLLRYPDIRVKYSSLKCLEKLFEIFQNDRSVAVIIKAREAGIERTLEENCESDRTAICALCKSILDTYFPVD